MFYTLVQNNSGGYFIKNEDVRERVIIEANTAKEAEEISYEITRDYMEYCKCCGKRWNIWFDELDANDEPKIFGIPISEMRKSRYVSSCIIYYLDGRKEIIEFE